MNTPPIVPHSDRTITPLTRFSGQFERCFQCKANGGGLTCLQRALPVLTMPVLFTMAARVTV